MGRAGRKSGCGFFKRHSGLLMSAALVASACQGFCMLGGGVSSGMKYGFKYGFVPGTGGRVTRKARQGEGCQQPPQSRKEDWQRNANDSHNQPEGARGRPEAGVLDTVAEAFSHACHQMTGGGLANDEEVQKARREVQQKGGYLVSNSGTPGLIHCAGCDLGKWDKVVESLAMLFDLDNKSKETLKNAQFLDQAETEYFVDTVERKVRKTTYTAFCTMRDETHQKMHVIYGRHQLSMEAIEAGATYPPQNCINYGDRTFTVLPQASPHAIGCGQDMKGQSFGIPAGWRVWDASAGDQTQVVQNVIKPYTWNVDRIVGKQGQNFPVWRTAYCGNIAGGKVVDNMNVGYDPVQRRYCFPLTARLLIEKEPHTSFELQQAWIRFVRLSAQAEWSSRLGRHRQDATGRAPQRPRKVS